MAGFYGFPEGERDLPALMHLHGGGQRAFLHEVKRFAKRGYATLSINCGGREMEMAQSGDPNTEWGAVDPTQNNVSGYSSIIPSDKTIDPFPSPRNNNWFLLAIGGRRGLTFLEHQPEVDSKRIGVYGHSMGGRLTGLVAGSDERVSTASPSVGGSGFLQSDLWGLLIRQEEFVVIWASSKEQSQDKFFYQEYVVQFSTSVPPMTLTPLWILLKKGCHSYPTTISAQSMPHI